jgi:Immunity protein 63
MAEPVTEEVLREKIRRVASIIGCGRYDVIGFNSGIDNAYPYVQIGPGDELHWMVRERGEILADLVTRDVDELLYWIFSSVTGDMATRWECDNRVGDQDSRIAMWNKHVELLAMLNPDWAMRWRHELLRRVPDAVELLSR